jgi:hypothetical protein
MLGNVNEAIRSSGGGFEAPFTHASFGITFGRKRIWEEFPDLLQR